jgi:hypothetical protein
MGYSADSIYGMKISFQADDVDTLICLCKGIAEHYKLISHCFNCADLLTLSLSS